VYPRGVRYRETEQDLGNPVGEELVRRYEMPGFSGKKRYELVDWEGYLGEELLD